MKICENAQLNLLLALILPGYAIGGVAVGEAREAIEKIVMFTRDFLPVEKPRYLMGIGTPWDIANAIRCGIDMFDCVSPTRLGRHGSVFTQQGRISLRTSKYATDFSPPRRRLSLLYLFKIIVVLIGII